MELNEQFMPEAEQRDSYETGSTNPPKQHRNIIAVILALVIFVSGISSIMSIMNIRLFEQFNTVITFSPADELQRQEDHFNVPQLGIHGEHIPETYRRYYRLPTGVYITDLEEGSPAQQAGLQISDIIIGVDGVRINTLDELNELLGSYEAGRYIMLIIYRDHEQYGAYITLPTG